MPAKDQTTVLLASADPGLMEALEDRLRENGACVRVIQSAAGVLDALAAESAATLVLLDTKLPGMAVGRLLAATSERRTGRHHPVILLSDTVDEEWVGWLSEGVFEDLIPRTENPHWRFRIQAAFLRRRQLHELEQLRKVANEKLKTDPLTGVYNRAALLSILFQETDRVQRMKTGLSLLLFDIDDFGHWNARLGSETCDALLCQVAGRAARVLRSYDLIGRAGEDEFLSVLPGCTTINAAMLAERLRAEVFAAPFRIVAGEVVRLSACFGITSSEGRSPVVVLREAELALERAKKSGPESIQCFSPGRKAAPAPVAFLSADSGDELVVW